MISIDYAAAPAQGSPMTSIFMMALIFGAFYFFMIRPQQKKAKEHKTMIEALKRNDEVLTAGGLLGKVTSLNEQYVYIEIAPRVEIGMQRMQIVNVLPKGTIKESRRDEPNAVSDNHKKSKGNKNKGNQETHSENSQENKQEKVIEKTDDSESGNA